MSLISKNNLKMTLSISWLNSRQIQNYSVNYKADTRWKKTYIQHANLKVFFGLLLDGNHKSTQNLTGLL